MGKGATYSDEVHAEQEREDEEATKGAICPVEQGRIERVERISVEPDRDANPTCYDDDSDSHQ